MDFIERLTEKVNTFPNLPIKCKMGYLDAGESFVVYPLPGSQVTQTYMNGATDQRLNFEFAMQSRTQSVINRTLWAVQTELEKITDIQSNNGSFEFQDIAITNKPFINQIDEQGWFVFLLDVQANITVLNKEE